MSVPLTRKTSTARPPVTMAGTVQKALRKKFPPRQSPGAWLATSLDRKGALDLLNTFSEGVPKHTHVYRLRSASRLLSWLETFPGDNWQQRWHNSPAESQPRSWTDLLTVWLREQGRAAGSKAEHRTGALALIRADVIRPGLAWLMTSRSPHYRDTAAAFRDPEGFAALEMAAGSDFWQDRLAMQAAHQIAMLILSKGGKINDITVGDCLELKDVEARTYRQFDGRTLFYTWLRNLEIFPPDAPATLRDVTKHTGQVSVAQLVDRYQLKCRPIRNLLVDYLAEREPALDYRSLEQLARCLAHLFWADLEQHHPGINSLHLDAEVIVAWKERIRTKKTRRRMPDGTVAEISSPRMSAIERMNEVRAFYLDLAQWAVEEPSRWGPWVAPCPIRERELSFKKHDKQQKARMDRRTRERLPVLPALVRAADQRLKAARQRLEAVLAAEPGTTFTVLGETYTRVMGTDRVDRVRSTNVYDEAGKRIHLGQAEHRAFWAWATVEFLRHTGARIEEMLETSHHSIIQYTLPTTTEVVPLLQIAPSKTDEERVLLVTPELADVLSAIVQRVRGADGKVPLVDSYDASEKVWNPPMPLLFQWKTGGQSRAVSQNTIRRALSEMLETADITDTAGQPLSYQPHDFRRIFVTDAIANGLPPHIAMIICGHKDISTTMGYKAVYPTEAIEAHRAFISRRRSLRPGEEYRTPTTEEWDAFLGHFEKRKLSVGTCGRAFGTSCVHEHACVRCPMLRPEPAQRGRLEEIRINLIARITEAQREGWLGEVERLETSLVATGEKLAQLDAEVVRRTGAVDLGMPSFSQIAVRTSAATPGETS
ncbi:site-specific integrase [Streptomyces cyaneofuscatus]|uniref:site-specific integrase n=1 Tax=Streptomyces cyaneofuscatus TaxID=66883 RepID=UPI0033B44017